MKQILEAMLYELEWLSKNAGNWEYYLGKYDLCKELLSKYPDEPYNEYSYDDEYCDYHNDFESRYYDDLAYYKQQEIDNMYNTHYHYSWWIGKNIMSTDSYWFTSDEIEAFREIWQRRISA